MDNNVNNQQWSDYIELPVKKSGPIKLDKILEKRLKAFVKARATRMRAQGQLEKEVRTKKPPPERGR